MATKISELPTTQKVGSILDETLNVGGAAATATTATVTIPRTTATTNTVEPLLALNRQSSGTPAAGIGASLVFDVETAADNTERGACIEAVTTDVTATSEDFDLVFKTMAGGAAAAERFRITSTGVMGGSGVTSFVVGSGTSTMAGGLIGASFIRSDSLGFYNRSDAGMYRLGASDDAALARNAAGVVEVNNGSAGTFRDLKARDVILSRDLTAVHILGTGTSPTVADNGGNDSTIAGKDTACKVTVGTGTTTSITITFGTAFTTAPVCVVSGSVSSDIKVTTTTSTAVLTHTGFTDTEVLHVVCIGF